MAAAGAAARAIERASYGDWPASLLAGRGVALILVLIAVAWTRLVSRLLTGQGFWLNFGQAKAGEASANQNGHCRCWMVLFVGETPRHRPQRIPISVAHSAAAYRHVTQGILLPFIILGFFRCLTAIQSDRITAPSRDQLFPAIHPAHLLDHRTKHARLGAQRLAMLLLTPVRRRHIFRGKILVLAALAAFHILLAHFSSSNGALIDGVWAFLGC